MERYPRTIQSPLAIDPSGTLYHTHALDYTHNTHGTFMGMIYLSRNLTDAKEHLGSTSIAQPVLSLQQSVNKYFSHKSDVLPILCIVLIRYKE